jgi:hypothetical protein
MYILWRRFVGREGGLANGWVCVERFVAGDGYFADWDAGMFESPDQQS